MCQFGVQTIFVCVQDVPPTLVLIVSAKDKIHHRGVFRVCLAFCLICGSMQFQELYPTVHIFNQLSRSPSLKAGLP